MLLDNIIEMENKFIKDHGKIPKVLKLNYMHYCALVKELDETYFIDRVHGMKLRIISDNKIELE